MVGTHKAKTGGLRIQDYPELEDDSLGYIVSLTTE